LEQEISINKDLSTEEKYNLLGEQLKHLITKEDHYLSSLSNFTAAMKQTFDKISWIGFYLFDGVKLYLGPFQGKVACTSIEMGKGVCGTAALSRKTVIVPDVNKFPGHIACDADSRSEIVIPLIKGEKLIGVLDVDSAEYDSFNETDKKYLEQFCSLIVTETGI
jgi:L-methionine (R)-S-oxide reductase